jgi:peptidyl-prolyl cis-trans isomerase A (cyclophilin A)
MSLLDETECWAVRMAFEFLKIQRMKTFPLIASTVLLLGACSAGAQKPTNEIAPETFRVNLDTSRGPVVIEVTRANAPNGADRFYNLVKAKYFDGARFFRVIPGFMAQFGIAADPAMTRTWDVPIQDDPVKTSNVRGAVTFAQTSAPNSRSTQLFINFGDNGRLDGQRFAPFGKVVSGMENVDQIYSGDRENPEQGRIEAEGNAYLEKEFPRLDYIKTARIAQ